MSVFLFPKAKHTRAYSPRQFKNYRTYKRWLQQEFVRICVYCRQPDSYDPNLNFGVDHYRPKSIKRFKSLAASYTNLYYCCGSCNSRKNADWPVDEVKGPYIVNPCEHVMAAHLRFDVRSCRIEPRTPWGVHTERLLQLNANERIQFRKRHILTIKICEDAIANRRRDILELARKVKSGTLSPHEFAAEVLVVNSEIAEMEDLRDALTGAMKLPPLPKTRMRVVVHP